MDRESVASDRGEPELFDLDAGQGVAQFGEASRGYEANMPAPITLC